MSTARWWLPSGRSFSILERIDVGETSNSVLSYSPFGFTFSILERIDVGETFVVTDVLSGDFLFQYPRTDRRG